jgi:hypothetical protein
VRLVVDGTNRGVVPATGLRAGPAVDALSKPGSAAEGGPAVVPWLP